MGPRTHSEQCFQKPRIERKEDDRLRGPNPLGNACGLGFGELYNSMDIATKHIFKYIYFKIVKSKACCLTIKQVRL